MRPGLHGGAQQAGGIRMRRPADDRIDRSGFDETARVHHGDPIGDLTRHADVVGDEDARHAEFPLQRTQQQKDLDLHGRVQRRGRLIGQQQGGPARQRQSDHRALAQSARQFVRKGIEPARGGGDLHHLQQLERSFARIAPGHVFVRDDGLGDLRADGEHRIERGHRFLENHRRDRAAHRFQLTFRHRHDVISREADPAADARVRRQQAQQSAHRHGLAGAGFAKQAQHLAGVEVKRHVVDDLNVDVAVDETNREIGDLHQALRRHRRCPPPCCVRCRA